MRVCILAPVSPIAFVCALALAACNTASDPVSRASASELAPAASVASIMPLATQTPPAGVPHGGLIAHLAVTDQADAAVSVDNLGGLRLWPTLDGTREPIPFAVSGAQTLAITHAGNELLVGVVDEAGAGHLLRFTRAGALRANVPLPGETAIEQLIAIDGGVLVARADASLERYDAAGNRLGRIAIESGERLGAIAFRHGAAAALIGIAEPGTTPGSAPLEQVRTEPRARRPAPPPVPVLIERARALRWIEIGDGLHWGRTVELPAELDDQALAIAPGHHRIAISTRLGKLQVLDVDHRPHLVEGPDAVGELGSPLGFVDDDHVVRVFRTTHWWSAKAAAAPAKPDPWHVETGGGDETVNDIAGAFGDGRVVAGIGPDLLLQDLHDTRYLGWRDTASGALVAAGAHVGLETTSTHVVWLDRELQRETDLELGDLGLGTVNRAWWLDPDHAVVQSNDQNRVKLELVDLRHRDRRVDLGTYGYVARVELEPSLHVLAIADGGVIRRFSVDLERDRVDELPALDASTSLQTMRLLDPARANGAIAIVAGYGDDGERLITYRADGARRHARIRGKRSAALEGNVLGIAPDGTVYLRTAGAVIAQRDGKTGLHFPAGELSDLLVPDASGEHLASIHGTEVAMYLADGTVVWRQHVWGAQDVRFVAGGSRLVLRTAGGIVALDVATGARRAAACGFAFGLMTKTPQTGALNVQPVCEDLGT